MIFNVDFLFLKMILAMFITPTVKLTEISI